MLRLQHKIFMLSLSSTKNKMNYKIIRIKLKRMKNEKKYKGSVEEFITNKIYLNINHLEKGIYKLKLVHKNKIIKSVQFIKN